MNHKWQRCLGIIYEALEKNVQNTFQEIPPNHHPEDDTDNVTAVTSGTRFNECDLSTIDMYTLADAGVVREDVYQNQETHSIRLPRVAFRPPSPVQPNKSSESKKRPATPTYPNTNHDDKDKGRYWGPGKRCKTIKPKETPTQEHQVPDHHDDDSDAFYEWENLWNRHLVPDGWYCIRDNLYDPNSDGWTWIPPHSKDAVGKAEKNRDYFTTKEQVQQWCRTHNYKAKASGEIEEEVQEQKQKQSSQQESPGTQGMSSLEYDGSVPSTPESPRTRPQDPGLPQLPEEDEDDPYSWKILWPKLKELGWYHRPGKGLVSFLYIRPGKKVQGGKLGVDYFNSEVDVIAYEKKTDFVDTNEAEADDMVNTASASNTDSEIEDSHVSSSSSIASSSSSTVCTHAEDEWWRESRLPEFKQDIWPALQKLNFYYSTSYRLPKNAPVPKGQHSSFPDTYQLQQFLAKAGIPNWEKMRNVLTKRERIKIDCWVKFANVPVKPSSITEELGKIKVISDTQATKLLKKFAFKEMKGKIVHTETNESFASLKDVQSYIRGLSESMKGRRRKSTDPLEVEDELKLRLWAALSPLPLPKYPGAN